MAIDCPVVALWFAPLLSGGHGFRRSCQALWVWRTQASHLRLDALHVIIEHHAPTVRARILLGKPRVRSGNSI